MVTCFPTWRRVTLPEGRWVCSYPSQSHKLTGEELSAVCSARHINRYSREIFESLLAELTTSFKTQEDVETEYAEYREFSSSLANGLVSGAEVVGESLWPRSSLHFHDRQWSLQAGEW